MRFKFNDGGRSRYFKAQNVSDCVVRSIAIAKNIEYIKVYKEATKILGYTPRNGIKSSLDTFKLMYYFGFDFNHHLLKDYKIKELKAIIPDGVTILYFDGHLSCVINGVMNDTWDITRLRKKRYIKGYFTLK